MVARNDYILVDAGLNLRGKKIKLNQKIKFINYGFKNNSSN